MLQKLRHINLLQPRVITGVEVVIDSPKEYTFRYVQIKNYYGAISIKKSNENLIDFEQLVNEAGKNKKIPFSANPPIVVTFTGKQIVVKKITDYDEEDDDSRLLQKTLPGARLSEFYIQVYEQGKEIYTAVVKRTIVDEILEKLKSKGFYTHDVLLGPFAIMPFWEQLVKNGKLELPGYDFIFQNQELISVEQNSVKNGANVIIGEESLAFTEILPFVGAFYYYGRNHELVECSIDLLQTERTEIKFGIYQIAMLRLFMVLILFVSITNYFLGKNYTQAYESLQTATAEQKETFMLFQSQQQELVNRINLLNNTGVSSRSNLSYYADRLGELTPGSVQLLELKIVPIEKKLKKGERIQLDPTKILIKGVAPISLDLNEWVLKLDDENWVSETVIVNYSQTDREYPGIFDLEISLNG